MRLFYNQILYINFNQLNWSNFRYKYTLLLVEISKLRGSTMEDDEWMKLPVEDKVVHKLWKARV